MKANDSIINEIERLYSEYEKEVCKAHKDGLLELNTVRTYLLHSHNFVKWCKGVFEPGGKNRNNSDTLLHDLDVMIVGDSYLNKI